MADFDLFVIGGGSGGVACARRAASHGARVGLAEDRRLGGTCVIRGCVPKKLMRYGAAHGEAIRDARGYGWTTGEARHDFPALCEARNREVARLEGIYQGLLERAGVRLFPARAVIAGHDADAGFRLAVDGDTVTTRRVLLAVGGKPVLPPIPGIEHAMTSDRVLEDVYPLPERLAVVGAGYIGVEFASIFHGLGAKSRIILRGELPLRGFEDELRRHLAHEMRVAGITLDAGTTVHGIEPAGAGLVVRTSAGAIEADRVIYATGRAPRPNTSGIGLEALGVRLSQAGHVLVDADHAANVEGLFAVGDCSDHGGHGLGGGAFDLTPVAIAEGRALAEALFNNSPRTVNYQTIPTAVFSIPQASTVGLSEARAMAMGYDVKAFVTRFRPMLHTLTGSETRTMMKLVVDRPSDRVLGCHMVGEDAAEIIQGFAVALTAGATKAVFDATVALHPTAAEEFVTMHQPAA